MLYWWMFACLFALVATAGIMYALESNLGKNVWRRQKSILQRFSDESIGVNVYKYQIHKPHSDCTRHIQTGITVQTRTDTT
jgi:hypothetical protein